MTNENTRLVEIPVSTSKCGKYKNITLKTKRDKITGEVEVQGLNPGEHIILEKGDFSEGKPVGQFGSYLCSANYNGEKVSFFLSGDEHDGFKNGQPGFKDIGGAGDTIKVSSFIHEFKYQGKEGKSVRLRFELL